MRKVRGTGYYWTYLISVYVEHFNLRQAAVSDVAVIMFKQILSSHRIILYGTSDVFISQSSLTCLYMVRKQSVLGYWKYVGQIKHFSSGVLIWLDTDEGFSILESY